MPGAVHTVALSAALLLLVSGVAKLRAPRPAVDLLTALRLPHALRTVPVVRLVAAAELAVGVAYALTAARAAAALLAAAYLIFALVVVVLVARGTRVSCGCFGESDTTPGRGHLGVDLVATAAATWSAFDPGRLAWDGVTTGGVLALAAVLTALAYLTMTALPELAGLRRRLVEEA